MMVDTQWQMRILRSAPNKMLAGTYLSSVVCLIISYLISAPWWAAPAVQFVFAITAWWRGHKRGEHL